MSEPYSAAQTTFLLSILSNLASGQQGTPDEIEAYLAGRIDAHFETSKPNIGTWSRVWGPAVFQAPYSNVADNVMYVARNDAGRLVVSIAGTNPASALDVLIEDFFVGAEVPWPYAFELGKDRRIAAGTFTGLTILQYLRPGTAMPGAGQQLATFLAAQSGDPITIVVAGHSLGGALAPVVALWLHDTQAIWNPSRRAVVACEPSAGPTAGNAAFAAYYDTALGARTARIYNGIDLVPHAWNEKDLPQISALYAPAIPVDPLVAALAAAAGDLAAGGSYTQVARGTAPLAGTVNPGLIEPGAPAVENFLRQALYQHTQEYFTLMGVSWSAELVAAIGAPVNDANVDRLATRYRAALQRRASAAVS